MRPPVWNDRCPGRGRARPLRACVSRRTRGPRTAQARRDHRPHHPDAPRPDQITAPQVGYCRCNTYRRCERSVKPAASAEPALRRCRARPSPRPTSSPGVHGGRSTNSGRTSLDAGRRRRRNAAHLVLDQRPDRASHRGERVLDVDVAVVVHVCTSYTSPRSTMLMPSSGSKTFFSASRTASSSASPARPAPRRRPRRVGRRRFLRRIAISSCMRASCSRSTYPDSVLRTSPNGRSVPPSHERVRSAR